jgi:hypothetical protein
VRGKIFRTRTVQHFYTYLRYKSDFPIEDSPFWKFILCLKHLWNSRIVILSTTSCDSAWTFSVSSNFRPFNWIFICMHKNTLQWKYLSILTWSYRSLYTEKMFHFWTNLTAVRLLFKISFKITCFFYLCRPRMLKRRYTSGWASKTWKILNPNLPQFCDGYTIWKLVFSMALSVQPNLEYCISLKRWVCKSWPET